MKLIIASVFLSLGIVCAVISLFGICRFSYLMNRMHCAALIDAASFPLVIIGLIILSWDITYIPKLLLILLFQWITSPVCSHMVMRMEDESDPSSHTHYRKEDR